MIKKIESHEDTVYMPKGGAIKFQLLHLLYRHFEKGRETLELKDVYPEMAKRMGLNQRQREIMVSSGKEPKFHPAIRSNKNQLVLLGYIAKPVNRGEWKLTQQGYNYMKMLAS